MEEIRKYIEENYDELKQLAEILTKNDETHNSDELLQETLFSLLNRKKPLNEKMDLRLLFYVALHKQRYQKTSSYNRLYHTRIVDGEYSNKNDKELNGIEREENKELDFIINDEIDYKINKIKHILNELEKDGLIDWYQKEIFLRYYFPTKYFTKEELNGKDTISYRTLSKLLKPFDNMCIIHSSLYKTVNFVTMLIKNKIN